MTGKELWDLYRDKLVDIGLLSDTWEECDEDLKRAWTLIYKR